MGRSTGVMSDARDTPETLAQLRARKVAAVEAVLRRFDALAVGDALMREIAEECVAAAETGI